MITVSKSLAAGLPLSGVIGRAELLDAAAPGELGGTYAGSPLGCAAALAVLDIIEEEGLNEGSEEIGKMIERKAYEWKRESPSSVISGRLGAMAAIEIVKDLDTREPDKAKAAGIAAYANQNGLLLLTAGITGNMIRFLTPLVISDSLLNEGLSILEAGLRA